MKTTQKQTNFELNETKKNTSHFMQDLGKNNTDQNLQ